MLSTVGVGWSQVTVRKQKWGYLHTTKKINEIGLKKKRRKHGFIPLSSRILTPLNNNSGDDNGIISTLDGFSDSRQAIDRNRSV
jgi:hypothetical protein